MKRKRRVALSDQLRRFIRKGGLSRYKISQRTGIDNSTLCRFLHKKGGLSMDGLDRITDCLGLSLVQDVTTDEQKGGRTHGNGH